MNPLQSAALSGVIRKQLFRIFSSDLPVEPVVKNLWASSTAISAFRALGRPILVGISRKSMIADILGVPTDQRDQGTTATTAASVERGAAMVRAHDVRSTVHAVKIMAAIHGRAWN